MGSLYEVLIKLKLVLLLEIKRKEGQIASTYFGNDVGVLNTTIIQRHEREVGSNKLNSNFFFPRVYSIT